MNKKIIIILIVVSVICPLVIFLASDIDTIQDLMKPPRLYGGNEKIQMAFENSLKNSDDVLLKYPSEGEYRSAYVMNDIDRDGEDEAFVFYTLKSDETIVRINVLDRVDGKWKSVSDTAGDGSEVDSISFVDMNNDGKNEIIICWSLYESQTNKVVTIYQSINNKNIITGIKTLATEYYSHIKAVDLDGDGNVEIFLTQLYSSEEFPKAYAMLLKMKKDNTIDVVGEVELDGLVSGYSTPKIEKDSMGNPTKIYIDANKGENQMITEVVYWNNETKNLEAPFIDGKTLTNLVTLRTPGIASMDIDDDGKYEIPTDFVDEKNTLPPKNYKNETKLEITQWNKVVNDKLKPKAYSLVNFSDLYILMLDKSDINSIVAYNNVRHRKLTVYKKADNGQKGKELFSIITVAVSEWSNNPAKGYSILKRNDSIVYAYNITNDGIKAGIKPEKLSSNIKSLK